MLSEGEHPPSGNLLKTRGLVASRAGVAVATSEFQQEGTHANEPDRIRGGRSAADGAGPVRLPGAGTNRLVYLPHRGQSRRLQPVVDDVPGRRDLGRVHVPAW